MKQKVRMFVIHQTATSLQRIDNLTLEPDDIQP